MVAVVSAAVVAVRGVGVAVVAAVVVLSAAVMVAVFVATESGARILADRTVVVSEQVTQERCTDFRRREKDRYASAMPSAHS